MTDVGSSVSMGDRQTRVRSAVASWSKQLIDLGGRNQLLYYRDLKVGTLDLTEVLQDTPAAFLSLIDGQAVSLSPLFNPGQADDAQQDLASRSQAKWDRRARALFGKAKANDEEKGLRTLQLAWGLANWTSDRSSAEPMAPVLLCPMRLVPSGVSGHDFVLQRDGEWTANVALFHAMQVDFAKALVDEALEEALNGLESSGSPEEAFALVENAYADVPGFRIIDRRVLANFSYAKLPVALDLENSVERLVDLDLVAAIAGDEEAKHLVRARLMELASDIPVEISPEDEFLVLDADSSQSAAINAVVKGCNTVMQGPPGTGKSQSIANLVATLVARGKRVLFVAEKRAAIDAVLKRLEGVGLGNLVFDLHDGTAKRRQIAEGLADSLNRAASTTLPDVAEQHAELVRRRDQLNRYVVALHALRQPWRVSAYDAQSEMSATPESLRSDVRFRGATLQSLDADAMTECSEALREYAAHGGPQTSASGGPWAFALHSLTMPTAQEATLTLDLIERLSRTTLPALDAAISSLAPRFGNPGANRICDWAMLPGIVASGVEVQTHLLASVWACDISDLLQQLRPGLSGGVHGLATRIRNGAFRAARKQARSMSIAHPSNLRQLVDWLEESERVLAAWRALGMSESLPSEYSNEVARLRTASDTATTELALLKDLTGAECTQVACSEAFDHVERLLASRDVLGRLPELSRRRQFLVSHQLGDVVEYIDGALLSSGADAVSALRFIWFASILEAVKLSDPVLGAFDGRAQDEFVKEFDRLDREHIRVAAARVQRSCAERLIRVRDEHPSESELVVRQSLLKRGHLPMRKFLPRAANVLLSLKPCWAMSPLVVSQVLPSETLFDVVIFDEASQVPPCDAIPTVSRGRQVVVAGDRKQLPPSTFFMAGDEGIAEEDVDWDDSQLTTDDLESVLDLMTNILPSPYGTRSLRWHYRSRDERLIAFSNASFYGSDLVTFPGVDAEGCICHELVPTLFGLAGSDESGSGEVQRVVDLVAEHARLRPSESLGVIAMGIKHADRLEEALREASVHRPELREIQFTHPDEPFFVKNLERVQGDERDAIILTVGYGKNADGRLFYRFGPVNNEGGERRLNVAVTRAKRRMTVVSSFAAEEMDDSKLKKEGPRLLKAYLEYAASGGKGLPSRVVERPALNPFEMEVGERLRRSGIPVVPQYGVSGYWIDFAASHPEKPGKMVLAIECDGDRYHRSPSARDRDRLRQEHLERLGWRFVRIWSSEWSRDPEAQVARVLEAYEQAVTGDDCDGAPVEACEVPPPPDVGDSVSVRSDSALRVGPRPSVHRGLHIGDYSERQLVELLEWIQSDTLLRTRDEMVAELMYELGFQKRGKRIVAACERAIDRYLAVADPERLRAARAAGMDSLGQAGVSVTWDTGHGWHYQVSGQSLGPITWSELWQLARQGSVTADTPVWHKAFGVWLRAGDLSGLIE